MGTTLGTVNILGETSTETGDITMKAGKDSYQGGAAYGNFVISDDGAIISGGGVSLNGRNGDIHITDDIVAQKGITVDIESQGSVFVDRDVTVTENVDISTDKGSIEVDHAVNSDEGNVNLQSGTGDVMVGQDITAGQAVSITSQQGNVAVGDVTTDEGDILAENGDVSIQAGQDVIIVKTITAQGQEGDVDIKSGQGDIAVGNTVSSDEGNVSLQTGTGSVLVGKDITAGQDVSITSQQGDVLIGDPITGDDGDVLAKKGSVSIQTGQGYVGIVKTVTAQEGSIDIGSGKGDILIGNNGPSVKTVSAEQNVKLAAQDGVIEVYGKTETKKGDITVVARDKDNNNNLIIDGINFNGELYAGTEKKEKPDEVTGNLTLQTYNGDIEITDYTKAAGNINAKVENKGSIAFGVDVDTDGDLNFEVDEGDITVGNKLTATGDIAMTTGTGNINMGQDITAGKDVSISSQNGNVVIGDTTTGEGDVLSKTGDVSIQAGQDVSIVKTVKAQEGSIDIQAGTGDVTIGNNGPNVETVTAYKNIDINVELGQIEINGKTSTKEGDITLKAASENYVEGTAGQNIIINNDGITHNGVVESGRDATLITANSDLHVTDDIDVKQNLEVQVLGEGEILLDRDINVTGDTRISSTGKGSINGNNIVSTGTTHVSLTDGDLFLNRAEGKAVVLRMENNTAASRVNTVKAEASGGAGLDVELTGNFIQIGTIEAKGGSSVLQLSAMGAGNQKLISGEISVGSLRSGNGTHMPSLWANHGNIHVDEGNLAIDDVLAEDKIHLENNLTDLAIFGRTPTRDGEQLYYWNNLSRAYSKQRPFDLYTDGKVRTHRAVLIDAGRYYDKLYGDNLSVVDMMRERLTHLHGQFAFDSTLLTKRGEFLREKVLFGMDAVDAEIRKHNASYEELE